MSRSSLVLLVPGVLITLFIHQAGCAPFRAGSQDPQVTPAPVRRSPVPAEHKEELKKALVPLDQKFDPDQKMVHEQYSSPNYRGNLEGTQVHNTLASLTYALSLLDTDEDQPRQRAIDILRQVLPLQDTNPQSKTYGTWPHFLEEPLSQMPVPDLNWANFCATMLLQISRDHRQSIPPDLLNQVNQSIQIAAKLIEKRNVPPSYTNVFVSCVYVTLVGGETFNSSELRNYGLSSLRKLYDYTQFEGAFSEYNSPDYTPITLVGLGRLRRDVTEPAARQEIEVLYRLAWEEIATHFHPPSRQWAGPQSRSYHTLLEKSVLALIQWGTQNRVNFGVDEAPRAEQGLPLYRLPLPCPPDLEPYFTTLNAPRDVVKVFARAQPFGPGVTGSLRQMAGGSTSSGDVVGTTHLDPAYTVGSVNRGDLWAQSRPLIAYWGTASQPSYLRVRFMHDGHDYAGAQFFSSQALGDVIAAINFALDGGDVHPDIDRSKDGSIQARDLRLRFEFGGAAEAANISVPDSPGGIVSLRFGAVRVYLSVPYAHFGDSQGSWEQGKDKDTAWLDLVMYKGAAKTIRFSDLQQAAVAVAVRFATTDVGAPAVSPSEHGGRLQLKWGQLYLSVPVQPATRKELQKALVANPSSP